MINIALVDDHIIFLESLSSHLEQMEHVGVQFKASSCEELFLYLKKRKKHNIDVLLLDIKLKGMSGLQGLKRLAKQYPEIRVIMLSMFEESPFIFEANRLGAMSFVTKDANPLVLLEAIESVYENGFYVYKELSNVLISNIEAKQKTTLHLNPADLITKTEFEVLQYICQGYTAEKIGQLCHRSRRTIEGHKHRLFDKTNIKTTTGLVAWAFREGLVT